MTMNNATESAPRPSEAADNRARYPELAAAIDVVRAVFGPNVRAMKPYQLKPGETWLAIPTQVWPVKAPRSVTAAAKRRAGGR